MRLGRPRHGSGPYPSRKILRRAQHGPPDLPRVPNQTAGAEVARCLGDQMTNGLVAGRELAGAETPRSFPAPNARQGGMQVAHAGRFGRPGRKLRPSAATTTPST
jgi:hypothetical protein